MNLQTEVMRAFNGENVQIYNKEIDFTAPRNCSGENWENGLHIDHVIDIQYGGADSLDNVKPTHALCNINKTPKMQE